MLTLYKFWYGVGLRCVAHPEERFGQATFNYLAEQRPDLAEEVRGTVIDPFYLSAEETKGNANWQSFVEHIERSWYYKSDGIV